MKTSFVGPLLAAMSLAGCAHYVLDIDDAHKTPVALDPTPAIGTGTEFTAAGVSAQDLYLSVYVSATTPPGGAAINACGQALYDKFAFDQQTAISIDLIAGETSAALSTPIPIYTASSSSDACNIVYDHKYVFPPQTIATVGHINVEGIYAYSVMSSEKVSTYLKDAATLAGTFVSSAGTPIVATITNVLQSAIAGDVRSDFNEAFSQNNKLQDSLVDLEFQAAPATADGMDFPIVARPLSFWTNKITTDPPTPLGTLAIAIERDLTQIGTNKPGHLPDLTGIGDSTKIYTVVEDASGNKTPVYDYLDSVANAPPAQAVDAVRNLAGNATPSAVTQACSALRVTLDKLGLNRIDNTAFLWRVYTWSAYAQKNQNPTSFGPCLQSSAELSLINGLGLMSWIPSQHLFALPVSPRGHGVPRFFVPGMPR